MELFAHSGDPASEANFDELRRGLKPQFHVPSFVNLWTAQAGFGAPKIVLYPGLELVAMTMVLNGITATAITAFGLPSVEWWPKGLVAAPVNYWTGAARATGSVLISSAGGVQLIDNVDAYNSRDFWNVAVTYSTNKG